MPVLAEKDQRLAEKLLEARKELLRDNPLLGFHACEEPCGGIGCQPRAKQHEFLAAQDRIVAAFAGNRFGKTTGLVVWAIVQHVPVDALPPRLLPFRRPRKHAFPVVGRYLCPSQKAIETIVLPELKKWMPTSILRGGRWDKAYAAKHQIVYFRDGGRLELFTYEQDPGVGVGTSMDYVLYDEPPPERWYRENLPRTTDRSGCHRFGLTPVNMQGGGIGWIKRELFDKSKDTHPEHNPNICVIRGSIHDNPMLDPDEIEFTLKQYPTDERQAREHGDFIHFGGMIYPQGFDYRLIDPPTPDMVRNRDVWIGIDPGLKNAAFVWVAFDDDNVAYVFDEALLKEKTPVDYARLIRLKNAQWGFLKRPIYVIDPSARNRSFTNRESVEAELARQGIHCVHGQNDVQAGVQQIRRRLQEKMIFISKDCRGLRLEAEEYRMEDREDGEFKVVKENDHRLDSLRYVCMARPFYPEPKTERVRYSLLQGEKAFVPPLEQLESLISPPQPSYPMGDFS